jgi:hypothetical protein
MRFSSQLVRSVQLSMADSQLTAKWSHNVAADNRPADRNDRAVVRREGQVQRLPGGRPGATAVRRTTPADRGRPTRYVYYPHAQEGPRTTAPGSSTGRTASLPSSRSSTAEPKAYWCHRATSTADSRSSSRNGSRDTPVTTWPTSTPDRLRRRCPGRSPRAERRVRADWQASAAQGEGSPRHDHAVRRRQASRPRKGDGDHPTLDGPRGRCQRRCQCGRTAHQQLRAAVRLHRHDRERFPSA